MDAESHGTARLGRTLIGLIELISKGRIHLGDGYENLGALSE
jgi:hypothetical protein